MRRKARLFAVGLVLLVVVAAVAWLVVPWLIARRVVAAAAERGFDAVVGSVSLGLGTVTIHELSLTDKSAPSVHVQVARIEVGLAGLRVAHLRAVAPAVSLRAGLRSLDELRVVALRLRATGAAPSGGAGGAAPPVVQVEGGTVQIDQLLGDVGAFASGLGGTLRPGEASLSASLVVRRGPANLAGPFPLHLEQRGDVESLVVGSEAARLTVEARPGVSQTSLVVRAQPLPALGVRPAPPFPDGARIELDLRHERRGDTVSGQVKASSTLVRLAGSSGPVPASLDVAYAGAGAEATLQRGAFTLGPFRGTAAGGVAFGALPRARLTFAAAPVPCAEIAKAMVDGVSPGLTQALQGFGLAKTFDVVKGEVGATAALDLDLAALDRATLTVKPTGQCGMPTFLPR